MDLADYITEIERHAVLAAVAQTKGDKIRAAQLLKIGKTTLYRKLKIYQSSDFLPEPPNGYSLTLGTSQQS